MEGVKIPETGETQTDELNREFWTIFPSKYNEVSKVAPSLEKEKHSREWRPRI